MDYSAILRNAIDLHVHVGPEIIPRRFTINQLLAGEKGNLGGFGVKNHFFPSVAMAGSDDPSIINSVTLNRYVGGFNPDIIMASAQLSANPIIVWFPTLHAEKFLKGQNFEIPREWLDLKFRSRLRLRPAKDVLPLSVLDKNGKIKKEVDEVLAAIKECGAILATGHLSWEESSMLVRRAVSVFCIKKIVITHPIYQRIGMPVNIQKELVKMGALVEHCYSMYSIDKIPIGAIASQIKELGERNCIISSDVGQAFSKMPSEALEDFMGLLEKEGINEGGFKLMLVDNPNKLVG